MEAAPYALVVDDDAMILMDASDILQDAGFATLIALDSDRALETLVRFGSKIVLLFTDVEMPGVMNGFQLAQHTARHWPEIGILVASGNVEPKEGDLPESATFLGKPFSAEIVHGRIQEMLPDGRKPEPLKYKP